MSAHHLAESGWNHRDSSDSSSILRTIYPVRIRHPFMETVALRASRLVNEHKRNTSLLFALALYYPPISTSISPGNNHDSPIQTNTSSVVLDKNRNAGSDCDAIGRRNWDPLYCGIAVVGLLDGQP